VRPWHAFALRQLLAGGSQLGKRKRPSHLDTADTPDLPVSIPKIRARTEQGRQNRDNMGSQSLNPGCASASLDFDEVFLHIQVHVVLIMENTEIYVL
jgi:hypothetical protein